VVLLLLGLAACGCDNSAQKPAAPPVQEVEVGLPVIMKQVVDYVDFTGQTVAMKSVDVRARVSGYLEKVKFREGYEVREGDELFLIDPRTYEADKNRAEATLAQNRAHLERLTKDFGRVEELLAKKAISQSDYDQTAGDHKEAEANVQTAQAALRLAELNVAFTKVTAPISGRISRQNIDPGNLVVADNTILTTVVSLDPIYAYFDVDEGTTLRFRRLIEAGKVQSARDVKSPVYLGLADEGDKYPHEGTITFVDNRLDPSTGTLCLRGMFDNHMNFLAPGMFVRIRVPIGEPHRAILAAERAIGSDQGQKFLYVLNDKNQVVYREVQTGGLQNGMRVIENGLAPGERFIINGLQRVKAGDTVLAKLVPCPSPGEDQGQAKAVVIQDRKPAPVLAHELPRVPEARVPEDGRGAGKARQAQTKYVDLRPPVLPKDTSFQKGDGRGGGKLR
jgi:RND family efflux transporter MFP subunit